mmetsp:Transcript_47144/g.93826  ORF Transcript_47144/g.93826 Transcript_47144/m.93826 type:complete len:117 (+) Transcript_47144:655-1005(+)
MGYTDMMTNRDQTLDQVVVALEQLLGLMMLGLVILLDQQQPVLQAVMEHGSLRICLVIVFNKKLRLLLTPCPVSLVSQARLEQDLMVLAIGPHCVFTVLELAPAMTPSIQLSRSNT